MKVQKDRTPRTYARVREICESGVDWHHSATLVQKLAMELEEDLESTRESIREFLKRREACYFSPLDFYASMLDMHHMFDALLQNGVLEIPPDTHSVQAKTKDGPFKWEQVSKP